MEPNAPNLSPIDPANTTPVSDITPSVPKPDLSRPWDKLPDESIESFTRFKFFLNQGPQRSVKHAHALYRAQQSAHGSTRLQSNVKNPRPSNLWWGEAEKFNWHLRSAQYDLSKIEKTIKANEDAEERAREAVRQALAAVAEEIEQALQKDKGSVIEQYLGGKSGALDRLIQIHKLLNPTELNVKSSHRHVFEAVFNSNGVSHGPVLDLK